MTVPEWSLDDIKIIKCNQCGKDVSVNVNYPIEQVTCQVCYISKKMLDKGDLDF